MKKLAFAVCFVSCFAFAENEPCSTLLGARSSELMEQDGFRAEILEASKEYLTIYLNINH